MRADWFNKCCSRPQPDLTKFLSNKFACLILVALTDLSRTESTLSNGSIQTSGIGKCLAHLFLTVVFIIVDKFSARCCLKLLALEPTLSRVVAAAHLGHSLLPCAVTGHWSAIRGIID